MRVTLPCRCLGPVEANSYYFSSQYQQMCAYKLLPVKLIKLIYNTLRVHFWRAPTTLFLSLAPALTPLHLLTAPDFSSKVMDSRVEVEVAEELDLPTLVCFPLMTSAGVGRGFSELEGKAGHFLVLLLGELVLESSEELRVHLQDKALDVIYDRLQVLICVVGRLLHLLVPHVHLLQALGRQDESCSG